ncbi:MAG: ADP-forming succinate--CoA ligase subunit beta [Acidobacteriota bacterium]|nr:MAG: ADP-forming succinate--CoA ligase subunit beta [Acidobacteriota bacterium]
MNIHEYQAKELLARFGVPVPEGRVAETVEDVREAARALGGGVVVKAQIHAGGRGKGGGIKLADGPDAAADHAAAMLGKPLVTPQTGARGRIVRKVYVTRALNIDHEYYLGLLIDRAASKLLVMASAEGGVEIEKVAAETPEKLLKLHVDPIAGYLPWAGRRLGYGLGLAPAEVNAFVKLLGGLIKCFERCDASLVEINPLVRTPQGELFALDAKINLDDNGLGRHADLAELRDLHEEEPLEVEASRVGLNYIKLDGTVGCMVNGAGLAMATMDIIDLAGARPANFLDVGGGASKEAVTKAFQILLKDPDVRAVLVNIFGGIVRCDRVAEGVIAAAREVALDVPLVVRLQGTNAKQARALLEQSKLPLEVAEELDEAARKVVAAAGGTR